MDFKEIQELIRMVNKSDLTAVSLEIGATKIKIKKKGVEPGVIYAAPQPPVLSAPSPQVISAVPTVHAELQNAPAPKAEASNLHTVRSPMIGTYYAAPSPKDPPFIKVGDEVKKGQKICVIEAMKLFNDVECDVDGKIVKILIENAQPVDFDKPLFLIETH